MSSCTEDRAWLGSASQIVPSKSHRTPMRRATSAASRGWEERGAGLGAGLQCTVRRVEGWGRGKTFLTWVTSAFSLPGANQQQSTPHSFSGLHRKLASHSEICSLRA